MDNLITCLKILFPWNAHKLFKLFYARSLGRRSHEDGLRLEYDFPDLLQIREKIIYLYLPKLFLFRC